MILKEASKRVEWEYPPTIPCVMLDLSKEEERELNIRLNKNTGEFDMDILANEFDIDELTDWGFKHIDLDLNIDKIDEDTDASSIITIKENDLIKAQELYNDLKDKGYNVKIK
jgi:ParB-like chromosome segregation protein Spo0J